MRSLRSLIVLIFCLGLVIGPQAALAQPIPRALIRLCLRNLMTGIACYVIGRGGELLIDGSLTAAWAKAKETVTGEEPKDGGKSKPEPKPIPPTFAKSPLPTLTNPIIEPIKPSELSSLSKRLHSSLKQDPGSILTDGFLIYDAPKNDAKSGLKPLGAKSVIGESKPKSPVPTSSLSDFLQSKPPLAEPIREPLWLKLIQSQSGKPVPGADANRARNAGKLLPPATALTASGIGTLQSKCQSRRERETGLSLLAIFGAPDFDAKFKRRMEEVVKPCMVLRSF
jgi:hypothetical protein